MVDFDLDGTVKAIVEKPEVPPSNYVVMGLYFVYGSATERAKSAKPSARCKLEITSLLETYFQDGNLRVEKMGRGYARLHTGTHASLLYASNFVRTLTECQGLQVGSPDVVAYLSKWIAKEKINAHSEKFDKSAYGNHLENLN